MGGEDEGAWANIDGSVRKIISTMTGDGSHVFIIPCKEWQRVWE